MTPHHLERPSSPLASRGERFSLPPALCRQGGMRKRGQSQRPEWRGFSRSCDQVLVGEALAYGGGEQTGETVQRVAAHVAIAKAESSHA